MKMESGEIIIDKHGNKIFLVLLSSWILLLILVFFNFYYQQKTSSLIYIPVILIGGGLRFYLEKGIKKQYGDSTC